MSGKPNSIESAPTAAYHLQLNSGHPPIAGLDKVARQKKRDLERIEQRQTAAIRAWLLDTYSGKTAQARTKDGRVIVTTTMFGTFVTDYPGGLPPEAPAEINVLFSPAIFSTDLWPDDLSVGAVGYSSEIIGYVDLRGSFDGENFVVVKGNDTIRWTWTMHSPKNFTGVSFNIRMLIRRATAEKSHVGKELPIELPIRISPLSRPVSWHVILFSGLFSGAVMVEVGGRLLRYLIEKWKRKKKHLIFRPDEPPPNQER